MKVPLASFVKLRKNIFGVITLLVVLFVFLPTCYFTPSKDSSQKIFVSKPTTGRPESHSTLRLPPPLSQEEEKALNEERNKILQEMEGYNYTGLGLGRGITLENLVMEKGGEPIRNFLLASWRSGSSFTGALMASHPATYYEYEPLVHFDMNLVHPGKNAVEALQVLDGVLSCNYSHIPRVDKILEYNVHRSRHARRYCMFSGRMQHVSSGALKDPNFYSAMCRLFPFQLIKTVRVRLSIGKVLLENEKYGNMKMLLLVRDPRAIMHSREATRWCPTPDCSDVARLCLQMEEDFEEAEILREKYPDRFLALRYEDISLNPENASEKIFKFFRLPLHPRVKQFVKDHTTGYAYKRAEFRFLQRDSRQHTFQWMKDFLKKNLTVQEVERHCSKAIKLWGYREFFNRNYLNSSFVPLLEPPWPEMIVKETKYLTKAIDRT